MTGLQKRVAAVLLAAGILALQAVMAGALYGTIAYDFNYLYHGANVLANGGDLGDGAHYFAEFPNNKVLMLCFANVFRLCNLFGIENYMLVLVGINLLCVDIAIVLMADCARLLFGRKVFGVSLCLLVSVVGFHRGIVLPYSDTFCMLFSVLCLWLYARMPRGGWKRRGCIILLACSGVVGYKIKPQTAIVLIGMGVLLVLDVQWHKEYLQKLLLDAICFGLTLCVVLGGINLYVDHEIRPYISAEEEAETSVPFTHFLMMGMNEEGGGFFYSEDYQKTLSHPGHDAKVRFHKEEIARRLRSFGVMGYGRFLLQKSQRIYATANMDMWIRAPFARQGRSWETIRYVLFQENAGYPHYMGYVQGQWLLLLLGFVVPVFFFRRDGGRAGRGILLLRMMTVGLFVFLLLFEGGQRYLFHQLPIYCVLAAWGWCGVVQGACWKKLKDRVLGKKHEKKNVVLENFHRPLQREVTNVGS